MLGSPALSSAILALVVAATVSAMQAASHKVFPLRPIPSERWIEVLAGDPSKPGVPFVLRIHNDAGVCAHAPTDEISLSFKEVGGSAWVHELPSQRSSSLKLVRTVSSRARWLTTVAQRRRRSFRCTVSGPSQSTWSIRVMR
jgi:hypothetical protein